MSGAPTGLARLTQAGAVRLAAALSVASLPAVLFRESIAEAAALYPIAAGGAWFASGEALLMYVAAPLTALSACILFLAPGLLLALAIGAPTGPGDWTLEALALSIPTLGVAAGLALLVGASPVGGGFALLVLGCVLLAAGILLLRIRRGAAIAWPLATPDAAATIRSMIIVPALLVIAFAPKFFWEDFNGDGAHAFEAARLLLHQPLPFWDPAAGEIAGFPGITSALYAWPASWFIRLFGPVEASARLTMLLYMPVLFGALHALIAHGRERLEPAGRWLLWGALVIYFVAVSFSATYSPYSADMGLPAPQDTLLVACFLGFVLAFERARFGWLFGFAILTWLSLPNGFLLIGFFLAAVVLTRRPLPVRRLAFGAASLVGCVLLGALLARGIVALGHPPPGGEYGFGALIARFAFLQLTDVRRLLFLIIPCGVLPALALLAWRRQDDVARTLTLTTVAAFLFAFVQYHAPLHYYIPAMVPPLVVFWRMDPLRARRRLALSATAAGIVAGLALAWPRTIVPFTGIRAVGHAIDVRVPGYAETRVEIFRASTLLNDLVPYDWDPAVPERSLGTSPLVLLHYAHRRDASVPAAYVLQRAADPRPDGAMLIHDDGEFALFVRDTTAWRRHLALRPATPAGAVALTVDRGILFRSEPRPDRPYLIDLPAFAERLGIDVDALAARLGAK